MHAYCVDNCLVRVGDPTFIGYCISKGVQCGAKVVRKVDPAEPVGVVCRVNGKYGVVEYSEISKEDAERKTGAGGAGGGRLAFDAANIANHFYTLPFLQKVCTREFEDKLDYHIAHKKIKHIDPETQKVGGGGGGGPSSLTLVPVFFFCCLLLFLSPSHISKSRLAKRTASSWNCSSLIFSHSWAWRSLPCSQCHARMNSHR